ncbi:MAG: M15 family metallopeptidase [Oligoflexales bacterium]
MDAIARLTSRKIGFDYPSPTAKQLRALKQHSKASDCCRNPRIIGLNSYFHKGYNGALTTTIARESVVLALESVLQQLPRDYEFQVFDAFRTLAAQLALWDDIYSQQQRLNPNLSTDELRKITRNFVAHPVYPPLSPVLPHNSGGAIDLTLARNGKPLNMGTGFDEVSPMSATQWFEQDYDSNSGLAKQTWEEIRNNRRLFFNLMKDAGFVNYKAEWWHYNLGNCSWADTLGVDWYYPSLEDEGYSI